MWNLHYWTLDESALKYYNADKTQFQGSYLIKDILSVTVDSFDSKKNILSLDMVFILNIHINLSLMHREREVSN